MPNAKHLTFGTLRPKDLSQLLNAKKFSMNEQYHFKFETVRTQMLNQKKKKFIIFLSPLNYVFDFFSLLSHICLSPICLYLPFNSSLSSLPISASLSLTLFLSHKPPIFAHNQSCHGFCFA